MTTIRQLALLGFMFLLGAGGSYTFAQSKPAPAKAGTTETTPKPGEACSGEGCKPSADKAGMHDGMKKGMHDCPMMQGGAALTMDVTAENTKQGAVIRLVAKNAADVQKVQELAQMMAKHIGTGCEMSGEHEGHGDHDHDKKAGHEHHGESMK